MPTSPRGTRRKPHPSPFRSQLDALQAGHALQPVSSARPRRLHLVFGDQLDALAPSLLDLDRSGDLLLLVEVRAEAEHVPSHRQRTVLFLSAMRHFALERALDGFAVDYVTLDDRHNTQTFDGELRRAVERHHPAELHVIRSGEWRVEQMVDQWAATLGIPVQRHEPAHFYLTPSEFAGWAAGRKTTVLEYFYRWMRTREQVLLDAAGQPVGGRWNFDPENRESVSSNTTLPQPPLRFPPDPVTQEVLDLVRSTWPDGYGDLEAFGWPVTRAQGLEALDDFVTHRLADFGRFQDAMVTGQPWLNHSLLSPLLNLQLLDPRQCVAAAVDAWNRGLTPLNSVEGFVRQILGWREFIRGIYWFAGPEYGSGNHLDSHGRLPDWYWTGDVDMNCLQQSLGEVLAHGYGHHIQRLMVTGNFALTAGIRPRAISDWYLAMYVDAVDWVTLPNTFGMVMHADGGQVGTKPYASTGKYIDRMSDYCAGCRFKPEQRTGPDACPFTTFYWDFLARNADRFKRNPRMTLMLKSLERLPEAEQTAIASHAEALRQRYGITPG
jgi:deoxyribodipyrimidine photolyase-related protein